MTRRYISALGIIALLAVSTHYLLHRVISAQKSAAAEINISGMQRMLSQKVALYSVLLVETGDNGEKKEYRSQLLNTIEQLEKTHQALLNGDETLGLSGKLSVPIKEIYFSPPLMLDERLREFFRRVKSLASAADHDLSRENPDFAYITSEAPYTLLESLNSLTNQFQHKSESDIIFLEKMEEAIIVLIILTLISIGFFIFRPMVNKLEMENLSIRREEEKTRILIKSVGEGIVTTDISLNILMVNQELCKDFGYSEKELAGTPIEKLLAPYTDDVESKKAYTALMILNSPPLGRWFTLLGIRKNKSTFPIEARIERVETQKHGDFFYIFAVRNISERLRRESSLLMLSNAIEHADEMFVITDTNGKIEYVNPAFERITGYSFKEVFRQNPRILKSGIQDDAFYKTMWDTILAGKIWRGDLVNKNKRGDIYNEEMTISPVFDMGQKIRNFVAIKRDITKRKRTEESLLQKTEYIQLMQEITFTCGQHQTVDGAMQVFLDKICTYTNWPVGHVYFPNPDGELVSSKIWHIEDHARMLQFKTITEQTTFKVGEGLPGRVLAGGKPAWITDVTKDPNFPRAKLLPELPIKAAFAFPVMEGNSAVAVLEFFSHDDKPPDEAQQNLILYLATQLGRLTERKRSEEKLAIYTKKLEKALYRADDVLNSLAKKPVEIPYFVSSPVYRHTRSIGGGDNVRWISFSSKYAGVYLHDVSGHDIEEILLNILATALVDTYKVNLHRKAVATPSLFLSNMNEHLIRYCEKTDYYLTALYMLLDFEERSISYSLAGHPRPWRIAADGRAEKVGKPGCILGQFDIKPESEHRFLDTRLKLEKGETILIYSDGLMEQRNRAGIPFEQKFMKDVISRLSGKQPAKAYSILREEFEKYAEGMEISDDISFIFIGTRENDEYRTHSYRPGPELLAKIVDEKNGIYGTLKTLPAVFDHSWSEADDAAIINSIQEIYKPITERLVAAGYSAELLKRVEMTLGELAMNAIMHGNQCSAMSTIKVSHVISGEILEICVKDEGKGFHGNTIPQTIEENDLWNQHGRGLHMVRLLADEMYFCDSGNTCWVIFRLPVEG